ERIFMFLDLRSSTTIAEKLGEVRYFNLLYDFIRDSTESILANRGQIYQYVGDEIVVTWKVDRGIKQAYCLQCFFDIQRAIQANAEYYHNTYGLVPEFKAGLHYGHVMAGEIGLVKKDIAFSGDVLNTTARIQSMCNQLGVDILLSKYLLDRIAAEEPLIEAARFLGDIELRGKQERVMLYTL
ncbi:MAG: adenylate/guanylate cyclase domain-containing protein, partial [Bacteroidota bacterium]